MRIKEFCSALDIGAKFGDFIDFALPARAEWLDDSVFIGDERTDREVERVDLAVFRFSLDHQALLCVKGVFL